MSQGDTRTPGSLSLRLVTHSRFAFLLVFLPSFLCGGFIKTQSDYVSKTVYELLILLPQPLKHCVRHVPPAPGSSFALLIVQSKQFSPIALSGVKMQRTQAGTRLNISPCWLALTMLEGIMWAAEGEL